MSKVSILTEKQMQEMADEDAALRQQVEEWKKQIEDWKLLAAHADTAIISLTEENERLRAALREIEMNTNSPAEFQPQLTLGQLKFLQENVNRVARAALGKGHPL